MAERTRSERGRQPLPRSRTFDTTASPGTQIAWLWSRESLQRMGLSAVLALALWLYITSKQDPALAIDYPQPLPISTANVPAGLTVTTSLGYAHVLYRLDNSNTQVTPSNFHVFVDLAGLRPGLYHVPVSVVADPGIRVVRSSPARVSVLLDAMITKRIAVRAHILTNVPFGYFTQGIRIYPSTITVQGPRQLVSQVTQAAIDLNLSGVTSSLYNSYPLLLEDSRGVAISAASRLVVDPPQVQVNVPVKAAASYKSLPVLVPLHGQPQTGFGVVGVEVQPSEIIAKGSPSQLRRLSSVTSSGIWLGARRANFTTQVPLRLRSGVSSQTHTARVTIVIKPVDASATIELGIASQNVSPGLLARSHPAAVLVTVIGPSTALRSAARQMQATIDLRGLGVGTYQIAPHILVPHGFKLGNVYPATAAVQLEPR